MSIWWNVARNDGGFEAWKDGDEKHKLAARNEHELERQLYPNGVRDEWFEEILRQLAVGLLARVEVPLPGKFSQVMPES